MNYLGSKRISGKRIVDYIFSNVSGTMPFIEPFAGGLNFTDHVNRRIISPLLTDTLCISSIHLNEFNKYVVALIKAYKKGWTIYDFKHCDFVEQADEVSGNYIKGSRIIKKLYADIKQNQNIYPDEVVGFCGVGLSFGGKWFDGYKRCENNINYTRQFHNNILNSLPLWHWDTFISTNYLLMDLPPPPAILYIDPPYRNTTKGYIADIDHDVFDDWLVAKHKQGYHVFISEYNMPSDRFTSVVEFNTIITTNQFDNLSRTEKLYIVI